MLGYTLREQHPALFVEMRLGKTLVVIRRCLLYRPLDPGKGLRALVVAPGSALGSWVDELEQEGQDYVLALGSRLERLRLAQTSNWVLVNKEAHLSIPELADLSWDVVVLDESTFIKSPKALVTRFFRTHFRNVPHRWILTGTPNPISDLDFWEQINFLDGSAFRCSSYWSFRSRFFEPLPFSHDWGPKVGAQTEIKRAISKRCYVLTRKQVGIDLPIVHERRLLSLPQKLRRTYETAVKEMILEYKGGERARTKLAIVRVGWLRQLCGGFLVQDGGNAPDLVWRGKAIELFDLLAGELANSTVVVWFNYNHELLYVLGMLRKRGIVVDGMTGQTGFEDRQRVLRQFQKGALRVLLLQQAIAQTGMNLSCADTAIYYSAPMGYFARRQTEERILSINKKEPSLILDLCVRDSVDEALLQAMAVKSRKDKHLMERLMLLISRQAEGGTNVIDMG